MKKSGGGGRNWGNDAAAGMDNAAANAENDDGAGAGWGANGTAPNAEVYGVCVVVVWWMMLGALCKFFSFELKTDRRSLGDNKRMGEGSGWGRANSVVL